MSSWASLIPRGREERGGRSRLSTRMRSHTQAPPGCRIVHSRSRASGRALSMLRDRRSMTCTIEQSVDRIGRASRGRCAGCELSSRVQAHWRIDPQTGLCRVRHADLLCAHVWQAMSAVPRTPKSDDLVQMAIHDMQRQHDKRLHEVFASTLREIVLHAIGVFNAGTGLF